MFLVQNKQNLKFLIFFYHFVYFVLKLFKIVNLVKDMIEYFRLESRNPWNRWTPRLVPLEPPNIISYPFA